MIRNWYPVIGGRRDLDSKQASEDPAASYKSVHDRELICKAMGWISFHAPLAPQAGVLVAFGNNPEVSQTRPPDSPEEACIAERCQNITREPKYRAYNPLLWPPSRVHLIHKIPGVSQGSTPGYYLPTLLVGPHPPDYKRRRTKRWLQPDVGLGTFNQELTRGHSPFAGLQLHRYGWTPTTLAPRTKSPDSSGAFTTSRLTPSASL